MILAMKYIKWIAPLVLFAAAGLWLFGHGKAVERAKCLDGRMKAISENLEIREQQNEDRNRRPDNATLDIILRRGQF